MNVTAGRELVDLLATYVRELELMYWKIGVFPVGRQIFTPFVVLELLPLSMS